MKDSRERVVGMMDKVYIILQTDEPHIAMMCLVAIIIKESIHNGLNKDIFLGKISDSWDLFKKDMQESQK